MSKIIEKFQQSNKDLDIQPVKGKGYDIRLVKHFGNLKVYRPVCYQPITEKELEDLINSINKGDQETFPNCLGKIRKRGIFYRLLAANIAGQDNDNEAKSKKSNELPAAADPPGQEKTKELKDNELEKTSEPAQQKKAEKSDQK